jgi:hypothetical protein
MKKFQSILSEKYSKYGLILEDPTAPEMPAGDAAPATEAPAPAGGDAAPTPAAGAETQKPQYDKPYQDLAKILYKALRLDFEDLDPTLQQRILTLKPDNIKNDEQAVTIFKEVETILQEVDSGAQSSEEGFGPGANKI